MESRFVRQRVVVLIAVVLVSFALRLVLADRYFGFWTGDDVEMLETGFRSTLTPTYEPWTLRNTILPELLISPMAALGNSLEIDSTRSLLFLASVPFAALSSLNVYLLYLLARRLFGDTKAALISALLYGSHWLPVGFGSTVYPRTVAVTALLGAALMLTGRSERPLWQYAAGMATALAFSFRYSEIIFGVSVVAMCAHLNSRGELTLRVVRYGVGILAGIVIFVGFWDYIEWQRPFASFVVFYKYTLVEKNASAFVANQPWYWYAWRSHRWVGPLLLLAFATRFWRAIPRSTVVATLAPLIVLSAIHHKDLRYVQSAIPFLCLIGGAGLGALLQVPRRRVTVLLSIVWISWSVSNLRFLEKKSMAAVLAAEHLAGVQRLHTVALQQVWAYGGKLFLGSDVAVREIPINLSLGVLDGLRDVDRVGLYTDLVSSGAAEALARMDFCVDREFRSGRSRSVTLFRRCGSPPG